VAGWGDAADGRVKLGKVAPQGGRQVRLRDVGEVQRVGGSQPLLDRPIRD